MHRNRVGNSCFQLTGYELGKQLVLSWTVECLFVWFPKLFIPLFLVPYSKNLVLGLQNPFVTYLDTSQCNCFRFELFFKRVFHQRDVKKFISLWNILLTKSCQNKKIERSRILDAIFPNKNS